MAENEKELKTPENKRITNQRYEQKTVEHLTVRLPKGKTEIIKNYVEQKRAEDSLNPMYRSVNVFVIALLEKEIGKDIKGVYAEAKEYEYTKEAKKEWAETDPLNFNEVSEEFKKNERYQSYMRWELENKWQEVKEDVVRDFIKRTEAYKKRLLDKSNDQNKIDSQS